MAIASNISRRIESSANYKWWAYCAIAVGMFLTVMDQSGVNIALPRIADQFSADIPTVQWITLGYVLATSALLMPMGRLSDMIGRKRVYMVGFVIFMAAAVLGGTGQTFSVLVIAKVIQGIGSAAIQANGMAVIIEVFPQRERGRALGLYMTVIGIGSVSGPILGGLLVSSLGWRAIFFASVPVGMLALILAAVVLRGRTPDQTAGAGMASFDWLGAFLSSSALISFLLGLTNAHRLGWGSPVIVTGFVLGIALVIGFIWWEHRANQPMLDLGFFRRSSFSMGVAARFVSFLAGSAVYFLMPFYLMQGLGYPASVAGLLMVPSSICMAIMGPISGRISDRIGTRRPAVVGMALSTSAMFVFSRLTVNSPAIHIIIGMILSGMGMGTFSSANTSAVMSSMGKREYGIASAFMNLTRTAANVTGIATATTIVTITMGSLGYLPSLAVVSEAAGQGAKVAFVTGLSNSFLISGVLMVSALVVSWFRSESRILPATNVAQSEDGVEQTH